MGNQNSGRPRKSVAALKLHGTYRKDRHGDRPDDTVDGALCQKPSWLEGEASAFWDRVIVPLALTGRAVELDGDLASGMCGWWAEYRSAETLKDKDLAWRNFVAAAAKFGLSPADRAKLAAPTSSGQSDFDKDMSKHA